MEKFSLLTGAIRILHMEFSRILIVVKLSRKCTVGFFFLER